MDIPLFSIPLYVINKEKEMVEVSEYFRIARLIARDISHGLKDSEALELEQWKTQLGQTDG